MKNRYGNAAVWLLIALSSLIWFFFFQGSDESNYESYSGSNPSYSSREYIEPENPYNTGSGHSAGYEWAQENNVSSCGGNSNSFIEGCEEYLSQQEEY